MYTSVTIKYNNVMWICHQSLGVIWIRFARRTFYIKCTKLLLTLTVHSFYESFHQLHSLLLRLSFNNSCEDEVKFNKHGELVGGFDITNLVTFWNDSYIRVKVGSLDLQAASDVTFTVDEDDIEWHEDLTQVGRFCLLQDKYCLTFFMYLVSVHT